MSIVTKNNLESFWVSDETKDYFFDNPDLFDAEISELCQKNLIPVSVAGNMLADFFIDENEEKLLKKAAMISDNSDKIYRSYFIENSDYVSDSYIIKDSIKIKSSERIYSSKNIEDSSNIEESENIYHSSYVNKSFNIISSQNIEDCDIIFGSKNIKSSTLLISCEEVSDSIFCRGIREKCKNCLLSTKNDGEYTILNHSVEEKDYYSFKRIFEEMLNKFNANAPIGPNVLITDFFRNYDNMALWQSIFTALPFKIVHSDYITMYSITFIGNFLKIKI